MDREKYQEEFKKRLKSIIGKKFDTTMVYPLSQIEIAFGDLWGHGKDEESLTDDEKMIRKKWQECRNNILNNGNQQKRNAFAEIDMYKIVWEGYKYEFKPVHVNGDQIHFSKEINNGNK